MDAEAEKALIMAFSVIVLLIALSLAIYMFSQVATTSEALAFYSDSTIYYDNVELEKDAIVYAGEDDINNGNSRIVTTDTIIPTLYRYYKENFCVKICDETGKLIQIFDVNLEGKVNGSVGDTTATAQNTVQTIQNYAYQKLFNDFMAADKKAYCLFGAPWLGNTELVKLRIDLFIEGKSGFINNTYVDYTGNKFAEARKNTKIQFKERFVNYSYTGQTIETEDGDTLVTGASAKDKTVIIYTMLPEITTTP